jgi:GDP/UDP-N,N'-diacetylbacillosamine 2-epimerase (hydrolysing)
MTSYNKKIKKICTVTGSRADFGILLNLLKKLNDHKNSRLSLIVTGTHLMKNYGMTKFEINENKLNIFKKIFISEKNERPIDISNVSSILIKKISKTFSILKPDLFIAIGDRYEIFISTYVATLFKVPIIHIGGGELTEGSYDNHFRHCISKMSTLHFVSHATYRKRLINMGENPNSVFNVGSLAIDNLRKMKLISKQVLEEKYKIDFDKKNFLVTFHPLTLDKNESIKQFQQLIKALTNLKNFNFIFTASNADQDGGKINRLIKNYSNSKKNINFVKSFGQKNYFSILQHIDGVIGNSSSGIIEVPSFKIGTVNIGDRQKGRIKSKSVVDCRPIYKEIMLAIKKISTKKFKQKIKNIKNPFEKRNTTDNIVKVIHLTNYKIKKTFYEKYNRK